jgi:hypothetical protein
MGGATAWVRQALRELGGDASDVAVKKYIREKEPTVAENHIGLALRKLRGNVVPAKTKTTTPARLKNQ